MTIFDRRNLPAISVAFTFFLIGCHAASGENIVEEQSKTCTQEASKTYVGLLFPPKIGNRVVVAFRGNVSALEVDATGEGYSGSSVYVPEGQTKVFGLASIDSFPEQNDVVNPDLYIFNAYEDGNLNNSNPEYFKIYNNFIANDEYERVSFYSEYCDVVAFHNHGVIKKAFIILKKNRKVKVLKGRDRGVSEVEYNEIYKKYAFPADVCAVKSAIALNGGWGIFYYPDKFFDYSMPSQINLSFNTCFNKLNTSEIRPGMGLDTVISFARRF